MADLRWHQQDGSKPIVRITDVGIVAVGAAPADVAAVDEAEKAVEQAPPDSAPADAAQEPGSAPLATPAAAEALVATSCAEAAQPPSTVPSARPSLRDAAHHVLNAWDDETGDRTGLADAIGALRAILVKRAPVPRSAGPRKPREGTKQQQVLAKPRPPEGATVTQIAEATGWQAHTVRGVFAGLNKRQGIAVEAAKRVRQVGPGKEGTTGSYTVCRLAEAG
ncbi:DUF3489 domain-containing protein [Dankookia sp. GCM10030260]|uniref:DUF3489 domain-containing protein n=1 Tax=Dankookia sp. GCM10030260 TaxID=3273390 RepID=UPI0036D22239